VPTWWWRVAEPDDGRRDEGVCKLHVIGVEAVDVEQCYFVEKIMLDGLAVVHVHEFARNEPAGNTAGRHPCMRDAEEVTVEAGEAAHFHPACLKGAGLKVCLVAVAKVMMAHIRRIADDEIEPERWFFPREVGELEHKAGFFPEPRGGLAVVRVDFKAAGFGNLFFAANLPERRIECAGADSRVKEMYFLADREKSGSTLENLESKRGRGRKLSQAVAVGLCFPGVEFFLKGETLLFQRFDCVCHD